MWFKWKCVGKWKNYKIEEKKAQHKKPTIIVLREEKGQHGEPTNNVW